MTRSSSKRPFVIVLFLMGWDHIQFFCSHRQTATVSPVERRYRDIGLFLS
jgi:hypothetical protein